MKTISARHVQIFIAGVLALTGFHSLMQVAVVLVTSIDAGAKITFGAAGLLSGLSLPISIGVLLRDGRAFLWMRAWLYVWTVLSILAFIKSFTSMDYNHQRPLELLPNMITYVALLSLLLCKGSDPTQIASTNQPLT